MNASQPMSQIEALAAAYQLDPTLRRWNALMEALRIPAERGAPYRNGSGDPTAEAAIARVDREKRK